MKRLLGAFDLPQRPPLLHEESGGPAPFRQGDAYQTLTETTSALLLGLSVLVLLDWIFPLSAVVRASWQMWSMTPDVALCFAVLGAVLLYYNRHTHLFWGRIVVMSAGVGIAIWGAIDPLVDAVLLVDRRWLNVFPDARVSEALKEVSPFTTGALVFQGCFMAAFPSLLRRHRRFGDWLGGANFLIMVVNTLFMMSFLYGDPVAPRGLPTPGFAAVCSTTLLSLGILGRFGPGYFPMRPFVGPSIDAVLLRKIMPVTITAILICSLLGNSLPASLDKTVSSYLALLLSALIMVVVVLRASRVIGTNVEEVLREGERLYAGLVGSLEDMGIALLNSQGRVILWNRGAERVTGYEGTEVAGERVATLFPADGIDIDRALARAAENGVSLSQGWTERKDGTSFWVESSVTAIAGRDGMLAGYSLVLRDLTGKKRADDELQASLKEKEVMLKEIHHRVKNNLQVISSLLRMQSEKAHDQASLDLFTDSQHRVRAMALVHEHLYRSQDLGRIDFPSYVSQLVMSLTRAYGASAVARNPTVQVENITLELDTAVPCGLILTELVSNALKYAYPDGKEGPIFVGVRVLPDGESYELMVSDRGVGMPAAEAARAEEGEKTLGLRLVHLLVKQLGGTIRLEKSEGTKFIITFKELRPDAVRLGRREP